MIAIKKVKKPDGTVADVYLSSPTQKCVIDGSHLTIMPAAIDPHVHFRTPGHEHKEDWATGALSAFLGGVTTVCDMPNNDPSCITYDDLIQKQKIIQGQLEKASIPLRYFLYFGASCGNLKEIPRVKDKAIAIKVFMGSSTGNLLVDDPKTLDEIFKMAADLDMLVAVHAEDEKTIQQNKLAFKDCTKPSVHSKIRSRDAALKAVSQAISLSAKYQTRLSILHVSTEEEVDLIRQAKSDNLPVYGEVTPHHLLLNEDHYETWGNKIKVNPPIRTSSDTKALWKALKEGTLDYIGTDHAPHTKEEKAREYEKAPSGIPSIQFFMPLLITESKKHNMSLETLIKVTRKNTESIFRLPEQNDYILVDLHSHNKIEDQKLKSKCSWSPYNQLQLSGHVAYIINQDKIFKIKEGALCPCN